MPTHEAFIDSHMDVVVSSQGENINDDADAMKHITGMEDIEETGLIKVSQSVFKQL